MPMPADGVVGLVPRFLVTIDAAKYNFGSFSTVKGLDVTWDIAEYRAGDAKNERWYYPGNTKYSTIKLERAVDPDGTKGVRKWLESNSFKYEIQSGKVELQDAKGTEVTHWTLRHVIPVKWSIVSFDASQSKVATETLELAHMGFLENE
jgi:phage tail-like protein